MKCKVFSEGHAPRYASYGSLPTSKPVAPVKEMRAYMGPRPAVTRSGKSARQPRAVSVRRLRAQIGGQEFLDLGEHADARGAARQPVIFAVEGDELVAQARRLER